MTIDVSKFLSENTEEIDKIFNDLYVRESSQHYRSRKRRSDTIRKLSTVKGGITSSPIFIRRALVTFLPQIHLYTEKNGSLSIVWQSHLHHIQVIQFHKDAEDTEKTYTYNISQKMSKLHFHFYVRNTEESFFDVLDKVAVARYPSDPVIGRSGYHCLCHTFESLMKLSQDADDCSLVGAKLSVYGNTNSAAVMNMANAIESYFAVVYNRLDIRHIRKSNVVYYQNRLSNGVLTLSALFVQIMQELKFQRKDPFITTLIIATIMDQFALQNHSNYHCGRSSAEENVMRLLGYDVEQSKSDEVQDNDLWVEEDEVPF